MKESRHTHTSRTATARANPPSALWYPLFPFALTLPRSQTEPAASASAASGNVNPPNKMWLLCHNATQQQSST